jgi:hypothetical protein
MRQGNNLPGEKPKNSTAPRSDPCALSEASRWMESPPSLFGYFPSCRLDIIYIVKLLLSGFLA